MPPWLLHHLLNLAITFAVVGLVAWRVGKRVTLTVHRVEAIDPRRPRRSVFITGRGAACPECREMFPAAWGLPGGWGDHILNEHPASGVAEDVRLWLAYSGRIGDS